MPTARELGFPVSVMNPVGVIGPAGLSPRRVQILHDAFRKWTEDSDCMKTIDQFPLIPWYRSGAELKAWVRQSFEKHRALAERLGVAVRRPD